MRELAQLLVPSVRWDPTLGFAPAKAAVMRAVAAGVGGFVVEGGSRDAVAELAAEIMQRSEEAPIIAVAPSSFIASSWSDAPASIPPAAAIASLREAIAVRRVARAVAREARQAGCNAILSPSCDVTRLASVDAFAREPADVALAVTEWIDAAQAEGVLCIAGRFPGAGGVPNTESGVATIRESEDMLYTRDLVPFRAAIDAGVAALLVAPFAYAALDASGTPAAGSSAIVGRLLRAQLGFDGLAVADAAALASPGGRRIGAAQLVSAGIDLILRPLNVDVELRALMDAHRGRALDGERVHEAAGRRRLRAELAGASALAPNADDDATWLNEAAERSIAVMRGRNVRVACPVEVAIAGNPSDGANAVVAAIAAGIGDAGADESRVRHVAAPSGVVRTPLVIVVLPRAGTSGSEPADDRRAGALCAEARRLGREAVVVWCGHPAVELAVPAATLVIACWSATTPMMRAAGRWLLRRV
jgi:beta-glucosidase-like glycosyl hydrolase